MASSSLPEDLVIEILSLLPAKSLSRFRCVCKSWCALIQNPRFVSKHLISNNTIETTKILVRRHYYRKDDFILLSNDTLEVSDCLELEYSREQHKVKLRILGSCYGIICVRNCSNDDIILWNPSTRQFKVVPESRIPHPPDSIIDDNWLEYGYGYDVKTNDFKVVRLVTFRNLRRTWEDLQRTEVYSLSTDSWRFIDAVAPAGYLYCTGRGWKSVNGILSILSDASKRETEDYEVLLSFDT